MKSDITSVSEQAIVVTGVRLFTPGESLGTEALSAGSQKVAIHVFNTAFDHELFWPIECYSQKQCIPVLYLYLKCYENLYKRKRNLVSNNHHTFNAFPETNFKQKRIYIYSYIQTKTKWMPHYVRIKIFLINSWENIECYIFIDCRN